MGGCVDVRLLVQPRALANCSRGENQCVHRHFGYRGVSCARCRALHAIAKELQNEPRLLFFSRWGNIPSFFLLLSTQTFHLEFRVVRERPRAAAWNTEYRTRNTPLHVVTPGSLLSLSVFESGKHHLFFWRRCLLFPPKHRDRRFKFSR